MTMPASTREAESSVHHQAPEPPRRVARCLFGSPEPGDLRRMELELERQMAEHANLRYGVDLETLTRRDDIDVLVVQVREPSPEPPEIEARIASLALVTAGLTAAGAPTQETPVTLVTPAETTPSQK